MGDFAKNVGICSSYMMKLWVLMEGLVFTLDLGFRRIEVNTDSSEIVMDINQGRTRRIEDLEIPEKIGSLLSRFDESIVMNAFRESN